MWWCPLLWAIATTSQCTLLYSACAKGRFPKGRDDAPDPTESGGWILNSCHFLNIFSLHLYYFSLSKPQQATSSLPLVSPAGAASAQLKGQLMPEGKQCGAVSAALPSTAGCMRCAEGVLWGQLSLYLSWCGQMLLLQWLQLLRLVTKPHPKKGYLSLSCSFSPCKGMITFSIIPSTL